MRHAISGMRHATYRIPHTCEVHQSLLAKLSHLDYLSTTPPKPHHLPLARCKHPPRHATSFVRQELFSQRSICDRNEARPRAGRSSCSSLTPSPLTTHQSPLTNHQSPITNHQSPHTTHHTPLTTHHTPHTTHHSPLTTQLTNH